jgi:hypothetical protein
MEPVEPYHGDVFDGSWAAEWVRIEALERLGLYERLVERLLKCIADPSAEASRLATTYWNRRMSEPSDGSEDPADVAEQAHDIEIDAYLELSALKQAALNLSAAGLFHNFEQTATSLGRCWMRRDCESIGHLEAWLKKNLEVDLQTQPFWDDLRELRLAANVIKHGEGESADALRAMNPTLFEYPGTSGLGGSLASPVSAALAGEDIFVTEADLSRYVGALKAYWQFVHDGLVHRSEEIPRPSPPKEAWTLRFGPSGAELLWIVERRSGGAGTVAFPAGDYDKARAELLRLAGADGAEAIEYALEMKRNGARVVPRRLSLPE